MIQIEYIFQNKKQIIHTKKNQYLYVINYKGAIERCQWGNIDNDFIPKGYFAYINDISSGLWDSYFPEYSVIVLDSFFMMDCDQSYHYFKVIKGNHLLAVKIKHENQSYIYCVFQNNSCLMSKFYFWPKVIKRISLSYDYRSFFASYIQSKNHFNN